MAMPVALYSGTYQTQMVTNTSLGHTLQAKQDDNTYTHTHTRALIHNF